MWPRVV
jgi:hypothetical protein